MLGTMTSGPGFLLSSVAETPAELEPCRATMKNIELKRNSDTQDRSREDFPRPD
jgi:hypothetical protein